MKKRVLVLCALVLSSACTRTPEMKLVRSAAEAMGGLDRIQALKTLTIEGEGDAPNLGQNLTPDGELPNWKVTEFRRSIDFANGRMRTAQRRDAQFLFAGATTQHQNQSLDGDVAFNTGEDGTARRAPASAARDRRIEMLHHPVTILRAALDPGVKLSNLRQQDKLEVVDLTIAAGD